MASRNIFHASPLPESHNVHLLNPPNAYHRRHIEGTMLESNEHTMMNYNVNFSHPNTLNSRAICDNYHHPVITLGNQQNMPYQTQNVPYCYNQRVNQTGAAMVYPPTENSRMAFKRKTPGRPVYENPYGYQFTGSSSNFPAHENHHLQLKPMPVCPWPLQPNGVYRYPDEALFSIGEDHQRNVRIRHNSAPQADLNPVWQSSSQLFHSSSSISSAPVVGGTSLPGAYSQRNHPTNTGQSSHLRNTEQNNAWNSDNSRNSYSRVPNLQGSDAQGTWGGPTSYDQRLVFNRTSSNYTYLAAGQGNSLSGTGSVSSSRIHSSSNRVPRNSIAGWPTFISGNAQHGWTSQGISITDAPYSAYAFDLFDEHRDMRLDIDSLSYEELLVLEETIGNVSTGLSEDHLSRCLTERLYCSSASAQDEACCPICLDEFKDKDSQGILKCHHVYHAACIKKWLGLKKTCPVCKASALDDDLKQKQKVSL